MPPLLFAALALTVSTFFTAIFGNAAFASELPKTQKQIFLTVDGIDTNNDWAKTTCSNLHKAITKYFPADAKCAYLSNEGFFEDVIGDAEKSKKYKFHFQLRKTSNSTWKLLVENWAPKDETDFKKLEWTLESTKEDVLQAHLEKISGNVLLLEEYNPEIKSLLLANGLIFSKRLQVSKDGAIKDTHTGKYLSDEDAYKIYAEESVKQKYFLKSALEIGALLGLASLNYYFPIPGKINPNVRDWQFWGWEGQRDRLENLRGLRFDDNSKEVNRDHSLAGMMYYQVARVNNFTTMESFLITLTASSVWEFIIEHREVVSINDQIITPVAGFVLGEVLHQMAAYLYKTDTIFGKTLATIFDVPSAYNNWMYKNTGGKYKDIKPYDFKQSSFGRFDIQLGQGHSSGAANKKANGKNLTFGISGEVINIPLFNEPGKVKALYTDSPFSQLIVNGIYSDEAFRNFHLLAKTVFAAYHAKNISLDEKGRKNGYSMIIGASSAVEYNDAAGKNEQADWTAKVNVIGPTLDLSAFINGVRVRAVMDVYGDFAMVRSYAIDGMKAAGDKLTNVQRILKDNEYYYASGITARSSLSIAYNRLEAGYSFSSTELSAFESRSRFVETETRRVAPIDSEKPQEIYLAYAIDRKWKIRYSVEVVNRAGTIDNGLYESSSKQVTHKGQLQYSF